MILRKSKRILRNKLKSLLSTNIREQLRIIREEYHFSVKRENVKPMAIFCLDGTYYTNGLVDRLRGMVSVYLYSKINKIDFRIQHEIPFELTDFLVPNKYDWILNKGEKSCNLRYSNPVCMFDYTKGWRLLFLRRKRQHHFYLNINLLNTIYKKSNKQYTFAGLYNDLFKPSPLLEEAIGKCKEDIGCDYITISFRFMQLLGDFKDEWGDTLNVEERSLLIQKSIEVVKKLRNVHPSIKKIVVTSDSQTFIDRVCSLDYVYVIPGIIEHIGHTDNNVQSNLHLKTFLDFYIISGAQKVYLGISGKMYNSNYARTAAIIGNKPFEVIKY